MNNSSIILLIIAFVITTWLRITRSDRLESRGERRVARILEGLDKEDYMVINDLMIDTDHGTTQIDHIVLSAYGIFVIETKNYSGWIYGGERSDSWTKNMYGRKYSFMNPIKQNYGHIKALSQKLGIPTSSFISIVVFTNRAQLKGDFESTVIYANQLLDEIRYHNVARLSYYQISQYRDELIGSTGYDAEKKKRHVEEIRSNEAVKRELLDSGFCPKCGGRLVERKGKYGSFYGCSNYPKCKFTINR